MSFECIIKPYRLISELSLIKVDNNCILILSLHLFFPASIRGLII